MNFKRIISLSLVVIMLVLSLASCNLQEIFGGMFGSTTTTTPDDTTTTTTTTTTTSTADPEPAPDPDEDDWAELYDIITVAEALEIAKSATTPTDSIYYVRGTVVTITSPDYGAMIINDGTGEISVYNTKGEDKSTSFPSLTEKPVKGDEVLLLCSLQNFNGTLEVKQAYLVDFKVADKSDIDVSKYTEMTIAEARDAERGAFVKVIGTVARITYATGMKPSGVYLVDGTNSIYVYDGDIAGQVQIGNNITVIGEKDYWILDSEQSNAQKFGYKGCCQIASATILENDKATNIIDFSWCEEMSVKDILEIPVTENVTTTIFKTTALIKKTPGSNFVNYYFLDLDGETGSYTYTQCNGSDFAWLDEFDGKICTVYLSPMNAKSTASDCFFRILPIAVVDEDFTFDLSKTAEFTVEYFGIDQFLSSYTGNPLLEVKTTVDSELLGFTGATLSYSSSNTELAYFEEVDGKLIFNVVEGAEGFVTVTVTGTYGDYTHAEKITISIGAAADIDSITVNEAIGTEINNTVTVKGIVGPSLVNQSGFYLIDETGAIPVRVDKTAFAGLEIGQEIIVTGTMAITKDGGGQLCIDSASIVANFYGKHDYSTESFIKDMTIEQIKSIKDSPDATTSVYVVTALVQKTSTQQGSYTNVTFNVGGIMLYTGQATQYAWIEEFFPEGETSATLTIEFALCDWNAKGLKGCILAVITEDGKVYNEFNFTTGN